MKYTFLSLSFNPHPVIRGLWGPDRHENCYCWKMSMNLVLGFHVILKNVAGYHSWMFLYSVGELKKIISNLMNTVRRPPTRPPRPGSCSSLLWLRFKSPKIIKIIPRNSSIPNRHTFERPHSLRNNQKAERIQLKQATPWKRYNPERTPVNYFTNIVDPRLAKQPLESNGGFAKHELTSK